MLKINHILSSWLPQDVHSLKWLIEQGVGERFVQSWAWHYYRQGLFDKIGPGIYKRSCDKGHWAGVVRLLQKELRKNVHICGRTALELQGDAHHIPLSPREVVFLTSYSRYTPPKWLLNFKVDCKFYFSRSSLIEEKFFNANKTKLLNTVDERHGIKVLCSCRELAILEFFNSTDFRNDFESAENYLEGMLGLRSDVVQSLLENCKSVKVKRAFLYLSEKLNMSYFKRLDLNSIDLGRGKRQLAKGFVRLDKKYQITVPIHYEEFVA